MLGVIGDYMTDVDVMLAKCGTSQHGSYPVCVRAATVERPGGAGAVAAMAAELGAEVLRAGDRLRSTRKIRHWLDGACILRIDQELIRPLASGEVRHVADKVANCPLILAADYRKGGVTPELWRALPAARVIADGPGEYPGAYGVMASERELGPIEDLCEAKAIGKRMQSMSSRVIVKWGRRGLLAMEGRYYSHLDAECERPHDVTGAGDMVLAAVGVAVSRGADWITAAKWASHLAGLKCQRRGAVPVPLAEAAWVPWATAVAEQSRAATGATTLR